MMLSFLTKPRSRFFRQSQVDDMDQPTIYSITEEEININDLLGQITLTSTGAAAIFTGMVRGVTTRDELHETTYLEYECYKPWQRQR